MANINLCINTGFYHDMFINLSVYVMDVFYCHLSDYPGAPEAPVISEIFKESCVATYEPPQNDGGTPITGYHLERRIISSARWVRLSRNAIAELTYKVTELIEGNEYEFRVAAENKVGMGPFSPPSKPITAKDPWGRFFMHFLRKGREIILFNFDIKEIYMKTSVFLKMKWRNVQRIHNIPNDKK